MDLKISVVAKIESKWYIGYINKDKFVVNGEVKKLSDVKEVSKYKTIKKWAKDNSHSIDIMSKLMEKLKMDALYVLDMPIKPTDKEFENYWWSGVNSKCNTCSKTCKQSSHVSVVKCKLYKRG